QGNPDWLSSAGSNADDSEWIVYEKDTFDNLGTHVVDPVSAIGLCNAPETAGDYRLHPCYPNPFNPATTIRYDLHKATIVTLHVYDLRGTVVNTLVHEKQQAGNYSVIWDGKDTRQRSVSGGVYLYRMQTDDGFIRAGKMILLK
ncbi:MAG: FlgD immunoglobulin-like domain containing protein, partial [bacterium]